MTYRMGEAVADGMLYIGKTSYGATCVELDTGELFSLITQCSVGQRIAVPRPPGEEGGNPSNRRWRRWAAVCRDQVLLGDLPRYAVR